MLSFQKITEEPSLYNDLEQMSTLQLLENINREDQTVAVAVTKAIPQIELLVNAMVDKLQAGGRLFYIGAGTSGRLGVLDASECPPTYGVDSGMINGIIAGGDKALRYSVENAEDNEEQGWRDLEQHKVHEGDIVLGLSASGTAPYVLGALKTARAHNIITSCIVCNPGSDIAAWSNYPIEIIVGPEFVSGSTRMKSGTAQKLVLNMISTATMVRLGYVEDNLMVNMKINNRKLLDRAVKIILRKTGTEDYIMAQKALAEAGSITEAVVLVNKSIT